MKRVAIKKHLPKLKPLDDLFSYFIRMRAMKRAGGCERCLTAKLDYKQLHCAHYHRRGKMSTRWHEDNATGLCPGCHRYLDDEAYDKVEFFRQLLGENKFQMINIAASKPQKVDKELTKIYLENKIKELG